MRAQNSCHHVYVWPAHTSNCLLQPLGKALLPKKRGFKEKCQFVRTEWYSTVFHCIYHIHRSILCFTIACYIILYYIFLYSITSIALYLDIVLFCIAFCQVIYTILYCITLHHFTSLHFAFFCSIILHCNTVHCITLFFALHFIVLCCIVLY